MWTLAFGHHEDRTPTHGYQPTREAAMAFAKSWRREVVVEAGILPSLSVKTARSWRDTVPFTAPSRGRGV